MKKISAGPFGEFVVASFEYPTSEAAKASFERLHDEMEEVSVFNTATPDMTRFFLVATWKVGHEAMEQFDWQDGVAIEPTTEQAQWAVGRRLGRAYAAWLAGDEIVHERIRHDVPIDIPGGARNG